MKLQLSVLSGCPELYAINKAKNRGKSHIRNLIPSRIRTIDKTRLVKKLGRITADTQKQVLAVLAELFAG
jgi:mRNA-degrading endonuclease toxin of MazEF toxin-antitoxin module